MNVPVIHARMVASVLMELIDIHANVLQDGKEVAARIVCTCIVQTFQCYKWKKIHEVLCLLKVDSCSFESFIFLLTYFLTCRKTLFTRK